MKSLYAIAFLLITATAAPAQQTTIRDANGRIVSTGSMDANGTRTWRDGSGKMIGTATTDSNGTTTIRDSSGRISGTEQRRR